jgi:hypothetical protein
MLLDFLSSASSVTPHDPFNGEPVPPVQTAPALGASSFTAMDVAK